MTAHLADRRPPETTPAPDNRRSDRAVRGPSAATMTRRASAQTYATIRLLADRDRRADAFRAYAYFRWVDDCLDDRLDSAAARGDFLRRQQGLLDAGYRGRMPDELRAEETWLAALIARDDEAGSGLRSYLRHMMAVMAFDTARRGRAVSAAELDGYTHTLATAVGDALFHFIGHDQQPPRDPARYAAIRGAHIIHMLRDAAEDIAVGYVNVPAEFLAASGLLTADELNAAGLGGALFDRPAFRDWVAARVALARQDFATGREFIRGLTCRRCRLAGRAYIARFEYVAGLIERDGYRLRAAYPERKSAGAALWMGARVIGIRD